MWALIATFVAVGLGAFLQRVSGMGIGLISAPLLMMLFGPIEGVLIVNVIAAVNAFASTLTQLRNVDWKFVGVIGIGMIIGIMPGAFVVRELPTNPLLILVGLLLLAALSIVTIGKRYVPLIDGTFPAVIAGAIGGFMNALAGAAGPAITIYTHAARWDQRRYAATLQPLFFIGGLVSFVSKVVVDAGDVSTVSASVWITGFVALACGLSLGVYSAKKISRVKAHSIALGLAGFGGLTAVVRGVIGLLQ